MRDVAEIKKIERWLKYLSYICCFVAFCLFIWLVYAILVDSDQSLTDLIGIIVLLIAAIITSYSALILAKSVMVNADAILLEGSIQLMERMEVDYIRKARIHLRPYLYKEKEVGDPKSFIDNDDNYRAFADMVHFWIKVAFILNHLGAIEAYIKDYGGIYYLEFFEKFRSVIDYHQRNRRPSAYKALVDLYEKWNDIIPRNDPHKYVI